MIFTFGKPVIDVKWQESAIEDVIQQFLWVSCTIKVKIKHNLETLQIRSDCRFLTTIDRTISEGFPASLYLG